MWQAPPSLPCLLHCSAACSQARPCAASHPCGCPATFGLCSLQERPQYLYHFVLHAALDAVEEQEWHSNAMHLGVVDRFNNLQVGRGSSSVYLWACRGQPLNGHQLQALCHDAAMMGGCRAAVHGLHACHAFTRTTRCFLYSSLPSPCIPRPQVSAFTTAAHVRFLLLHEGRSDDLVKSFFRDVYELYLRVGGSRVLVCQQQGAAEGVGA